MPEMKGDEVAKRIRELSKETRIICVSGDEETNTNFEFDGWLTKPIHIEHLQKYFQ